MFSHLSYVFKYPCIELEINFFNPPNPVTIKVSSPPACSSFSSVASVFSYTYLVPVIYKAYNLVQVNKSLAV